MAMRRLATANILTHALIQNDTAEAAKDTRNKPRKNTRNLSKAVRKPENIGKTIFIKRGLIKLS
jgi:hypothetical protein